MRFAGVIVAALLTPSFSLAQNVRDWSQQERFDDSDFVAIVRAERPIRVPNTHEFVSGDKSHGDFLQQHETKLNVVSVLKGKGRPKSIVLIHFLKRSGYQSSMGYPSTIRMRLKTVNPSEDDRANYLVYLCIRDDGKFEPVTGHNDPAQSMQRLVTQLEDMNASLQQFPDRSVEPDDPNSPLFGDPVRSKN
jgi:hypothetical protein